MSDAQNNILTTVISNTGTNGESSFLLATLVSTSRFRPKGYMEEVLASGRVDGDYIYIPFERTVELLKKYSESNPISGLKNDTTVWGPVLWDNFHTTICEIGDDKEASRHWLSVFHQWVPCGTCKAHYGKLIREFPPDLESKEAFIKWGVDIHNEVNKHLGKPIFIPDAETN